MAQGSTTYHLRISLSDVDRNVYEALDLRLARHPSETMRYLLTRTIAYCLSYEEGIAFSKGGLSDTDEPPITVRDLTGLLKVWIEIGSPSAERLHKAAKAAPKVALYTYTDIALLQREAKTRVIHKMDGIEVYRLEPAFLDAIDPNTAWPADAPAILPLVMTDFRAGLERARENASGLPLHVLVLPSWCHCTAADYDAELVRIGFDPTKFRRGSIQRRLIGLCSELGLPVMDATPWLEAAGDTRSSYLSDKGHLSARGHRIVAENLARELAPLWP